MAGGSGMSLRSMGFKSGDQIWTPSPGDRTVWDTIRDINHALRGDYEIQE